MGIPLSKFLNDYFGVDELKQALSDIGELTTGTKAVLVKRLIVQWEPHNRNKYDLLDYLDEDYLTNLCDDYNIDSNGDEDLLRRRIKKAGLNDSPKPSSMVDDQLISNKKTFEKLGLSNLESRKDKVDEKDVRKMHESQPNTQVNWIKWGAIFGGIAAIATVIGILLPYVYHL